MSSGWPQLVEGWPWFQGAGQYPISAYSEFLPPPLLGRKPYGCQDSLLFTAADPWGWHVTEYEEHLELRPGMDRLAQKVVSSMAHLGGGRQAHGIAKGKLIGNPYWPESLAKHAGTLHHERFVLFLPMALARTQDDKGRVRWTVFGTSEQGPARAFWLGFYDGPDQELPEEFAHTFLRNLLHSAYDEPLDGLADLRKAGLRILPCNDDADFCRQDGPMPSWTEPLLMGKGPAHGVRYLITFRPFASLPTAVQNAYLAGELHLLPFPGSLFFWGTSLYQQLREDLPFADQIPLLHLLNRREGWYGLRVPQSGWLHDVKPGESPDKHNFGPTRNTFRRTHRFERMRMQEEELTLTDHEDKVTHVLFSANEDDLGLYGKPMARNAQLWTTQHRLVLDGPNAGPQEIEQRASCGESGQFVWLSFSISADARRPARCLLA